MHFSQNEGNNIHLLNVSQNQEAMAAIVIIYKDFLLLEKLIDQRKFIKRINKRKSIFKIWTQRLCYFLINKFI